MDIKPSRCDSMCPRSFEVLSSQYLTEIIKMRAGNV